MPNPLPLIALLFLAVPSLCVIGISTYPYTPNYTTSSFKCIYQAGYHDVVFTVLESPRGVQANYVQSLINIRNAGCSVSLSFIPCSIRSAAEQVQDFVKKIPSGYYDRVWIQPSDNKQDQQCSWQEASLKPSAATQNCKLLTSLISQFHKNNIKTGITTSSILWKEYFGTTCSQLSATQPLYWLYPDQIASFEGFYPFNGWTKPAAKEYELSEHVCEILLDFYYHP